MPYASEFSSKLAHTPIARNLGVQELLSQCRYLQPPGSSQAVQLAGEFLPAPKGNVTLPSRVIAWDGTRWEAPLHDSSCASRIGLIQIGTVEFALADYQNVRTPEGWVDPFRLAALCQLQQSLQLCLPSSNVLWGPHQTVRESFRAVLDQSLAATTIQGKSLRDTLFLLGSERPGPLGTGNPRRLRLHKCPTCAEGPLEVGDTGPQSCPSCHAPVYGTDALRLHEEVFEDASNQNVLTRTMNVVEHLLAFHTLLRIAESSEPMPALFLDGSLALYGPPAWLHAPILRRIQKLQSPLLLIGVTKTGHLVDHFREIGAVVPHGRLLPVSDEYRYEHVVLSRSPSQQGFGFQTHYGADFLYKSPTGRQLVFSLPFPDADKGDPEFGKRKVDLANYPQLPAVLKLLDELATEIHADAVAPTVLAHRATAVSRMPGGRVLNLFCQQHFASSCQND